MLTVEGPEATPDNLNNNRFDLKTCTLIKLHSDTDIWLVQLNCLIGPYFFVYNENYYDQNMHIMHTYNRTGYAIQPMSK